MRRKRNEKIMIGMRKIKIEILTESFCFRRETSKIERVNFRRNQEFVLEKMSKNKENETKETKKRKQLTKRKRKDPN